MSVERNKLRAAVGFGGPAVERFFNRRTLIVKRAMDLLITLPCAFLLSPLIGLIALAVKLDSPGGAIFAQARIGRGGCVFTMYKFRSMVVGAANLGDGLFNYQGDPRVTRVGRWLRKWGLDEFPQLWNVIVGDMSLVGPRPPVVGELGELTALPASALLRFCVRPGITGLAQVAGRNELSWPEKIVHDTEYVDRLSRNGLGVDLKVLFATVGLLLTRRGLYDVKGKDQQLK